jgi:UV excision repair protein RAD23
LSEEGDEEDAALPPGTQAISVTEEERDAIERVSQGKSTRFIATY